jgi:rhomboid protease GluP
VEPGGSTVAYLAKSLCADRGFLPGMPEAAAAFTDAVDVVLCKEDGLVFTIVGILDRESQPERRFELSQEQVVAIGQACRAAMLPELVQPVHMQIWEVGRGAGDWKQLRKLARRAPADQVPVDVFALDVDAGKVRSTAFLNGLFAGRIWLERLLRAPRRSDDELMQPRVAPARRRGLPAVTLGLLLVLLALFVAEQVFGVKRSTGAGAPDIMTLVAMGGMSKPLIADGEWWRLYTSAFLHGDFFHLLFNGFALMLAGTVLEGLLGRAWLLALFTVGALGGGAMSYLINDAHLVSVGASGAIMALLAAAFVSSARLPQGAERSSIQMMMARILIPSLLPLGMAASEGQTIDYAGHAGGTIVGAVMGVLLLATWGAREPHPRFRGLARLLAAAGVGLFLFGFVQVHGHYGAWADEAKLQQALVPDEQLNGMNEEERGKRAAELVTSYPRDPRLRWLNAQRLVDAGDRAGAIAELRRGLSERVILEKAFKPDLELGMRALLAVELNEDGKPAEAREAAAPVCKAGPALKVQALDPLGLCP